MDFLNGEVATATEGVVQACATAEQNRMQRPFASSHEAWARLRELTESVKKEEKTLEKLLSDLWDAIKDRNDDETMIELRAIRQQSAAIALLWATVAAVGQLGAESGGEPV